MTKETSLIKTLINLKGNPRACVYTEPLWGIPYNLYTPYVSVFMYSLGVNDSQIGLIASIGMVFQIIFSLLGGILTDKLGRRRATFIFDSIAWSIPCLIWAISQNFYYFVIAAIINSVAKVTQNSWSCLLVEDCDKDQIVNIYTWVYISGLGAAFFAPISGFFVGKFSLIPTMRVLFIISFILMTSKFLILYKYSTETKHGKIRLEETKHSSMLTLFNGYGKVFKQILRTPETMLTLGIMLIMNICGMINNTFWAILLTERLHISNKGISLFPFLRSIIMLIFFITIIPKLNAKRFKRPLLVGFSTFIISQSILILSPDKGYTMLIVSILLEACSISLISPLLDSMQVVLVDPQERSRILSLLYVIVIGLTSPFGWIAGLLSSVDRRLPFILNICLLFLGVVLTYFASVISEKKKIYSE